MNLLNSNDDWIEGVRRYLYPKLNPYLKPVGGYSLGKVTESQYVGVLEEDEDTIERGLDDMCRRNPIAALKELNDGRVSEGSWVILHEDNPDLVEKGMQLHFTLFELQDGSRGREVYAHYEDDWRTSWLAHLRSMNLSASEGVDLATEYFNEHTFFVLK